MEFGIARLAGVVWLAYFGASVAGAGLKILPLSLAANAVYFGVAIALVRLFAPVDPIVAFGLLPLAALGCAIQSVGMIQNDREIQRFALIFFALFLAALGYLVLRSGLAPVLLGYALVAAGIAWCVAVAIPALPLPITAIAMVIGGVGEGALVLWLLLAR